MKENTFLVCKSLLRFNKMKESFMPDFIIDLEKNNLDQLIKKLDADDLSYITKNWSELVKEDTQEEQELEADAIIAFRSIANNTST